MYTISVTLLILALVNFSSSKNIYDESTPEKFTKDFTARQDTAENLISIPNNDVDIKRGNNVPVYSSCSEAQRETCNARNGGYRIGSSISSYANTYCQMTPLKGCSGGGWTLVMKIDGRKETFNYTSSYWTDKKSYNPQGGSSLDDQETKLPTYSTTAFTQLCVGMKVGNDLRYISIDQPASSLHSLIADGKHRATHLGRDTWKSLIRDSSLQSYCNKEGFNVQQDVGDGQTLAKVRIGIIGNQANNDCLTPDSYVGFGGPPANKRDYCETRGVITTCGNSATCNPDNGAKEIRAIGHIFVR